MDDDQIARFQDAYRVYTGHNLFEGISDPQPYDAYAHQPPQIVKVGEKTSTEPRVTTEVDAQAQFDAMREEESHEARDV